MSERDEYILCWLATLDRAQAERDRMQLEAERRTGILTPAARRSRYANSPMTVTGRPPSWTAMLEAQRTVRELVLERAHLWKQLREAWLLIRDTAAPQGGEDDAYNRGLKDAKAKKKVRSIP